MKYLILGSSLRGLDDVARTAVAEGHDVAVFDSERPGAPPGLEGSVLVLPSDWSPSFVDGVDRVVTTPWNAETRPPVADVLAAGVPVVTEAGFGLERLDLPYVAVTGTNGKTTVTEVTTAMLVASGVRAIAAGNIGTPISSLTGDEADVLILELSSYQLRFMDDLAPRAAALLNIAEDHLDWHGSFEAYAAAKASIVEGLDEAGVFAYNVDDPAVAAIAESCPSKAVPCSGSGVPVGGNGVDGDMLVVDGMRIPVDIGSETYRFDLVVAATLASSVGASERGIAEVAARFVPGAHRRERVGTVRGVVFVNDSKATNPHATTAAVAEYESVVLLVGGRNKGLDLAPLTTISNVRELIAFGEAGPEIAAAAGDDIYVAEGLTEAVRQSASVAVAGDTVLLSPGCASFDEFRSYEARGDAFREMVHSMEGWAA